MNRPCVATWLPPLSSRPATKPDSGASMRQMVSKHHSATVPPGQHKSETDALVERPGDVAATILQRSDHDHSEIHIVDRMGRRTDTSTLGGEIKRTTARGLFDNAHNL